MAKQIHFSFKGTEYTLEFSRKTVERMESNGFIPEKLGECPVTYIPMLFEGAFRLHQPFMKKPVIEEIYAGMPHKEQLIEKLAEMYNDSIMTLMEEPDDKAKNVDWEANW